MNRKTILIIGTIVVIMLAVIAVPKLFPEKGTYEELVLNKIEDNSFNIVMVDKYSYSVLNSRQNSFITDPTEIDRFNNIFKNLELVELKEMRLNKRNEVDKNDVAYVIYASNMKNKIFIRFYENSKDFAITIETIDSSIHKFYETVNNEIDFEALNTLIENNPI